MQSYIRRVGRSNAKSDIRKGGGGSSEKSDIIWVH